MHTKRAAPRQFRLPLLIDLVYPLRGHPKCVELAGHEIGDNGFEVGPLDFGLAVNGAKTGSAVDHEVNGLVRAVGTILGSSGPRA
jgi:hypothetical protein